MLAAELARDKSAVPKVRGFLEFMGDHVRWPFSPPGFGRSRGVALAGVRSLLAPQPGQAKTSKPKLRFNNPAQSHRAARCFPCTCAAAAGASAVCCNTYWFALSK